MKENNLSGNSGNPPTLVSFNPNVAQLTWMPLGDRVMGGQSDGTVARTEDGAGIFHGIVRLDNGGGFASVKADLPEPFDASHYTGIQLLALGDGKTYKIGLRNSTDRRSIVYQHGFMPENGKWTRIRLPFSDFIPTWRGRTAAEAEPLKTSQLASVSLFVSGRQAGEFELMMRDWLLY